MNKNKFLAACILSGVLVTAPAAYAAEDDIVEYFPKKVLQGFTNIATGFIEIPKNIINITNEHNIFVGMTWGILRGTAQAISRTFVGTAELLTSPFQTGELNTPAFVWERFSEDSRFFGRHYGGYWTTYGPLDDGDK